VKAVFAENELLLNADNLDAMLIGNSAQLSITFPVLWWLVMKTHNKVEINWNHPRELVNFHRLSSARHATSTYGH